MTKKQIWITSWIFASVVAITIRTIFPSAFITVIAIVIILTTLVSILKNLRGK